MLLTKDSLKKAGMKFNSFCSYMNILLLPSPQIVLTVKFITFMTMPQLGKTDLYLSLSF